MTLQNSDNQEPGLFGRLKRLVLGGARSPSDARVFQHLSLIAFFAWVGLGADGLSSSCYGPEEIQRTLHESQVQAPPAGQGTAAQPAPAPKPARHPERLGVFIALASALTVFVISAGYSQIIELFPSGGGGYLVASKLLSPHVGMVSGCALIIDYVLTIAVSIASGADAFFSFLPPAYHHYKLPMAAAGVVVLMVMNLRGVKESVVPLVPIFLIFVLTHAAVVIYGPIARHEQIPILASETAKEFSAARISLGPLALILLMLRAYSMGAGTYTGIEAVSNGLPVLRQPRVQTGKRTMTYMAFSLAFMVLGLMLGYQIFDVHYTQLLDPHTHQKIKTINAVLFEQAAQGWGAGGQAFVLIALLSEAAILMVAAQTGFLDAPRVMANMALDRWLPSRFASLSDRLVTQNGILVIGTAALITMLMTGGRVELLVVLYSINVFITFVLSQLGMVRHWWSDQGPQSKRRKGLVINGLGLLMTGAILVTVVVLKFHEGGYITLVVTGGLVAVALLTRRHYTRTLQMLRRLDTLVDAAQASPPDTALAPPPGTVPAYDPQAKTAVILVNNFNGLGLHSVFNVIRMFGGLFKNFVFVQVGVVDAGNFKGVQEVEALGQHIQEEVQKYVDFMHRNGYWAEGITAVGTDVVNEVSRQAPIILEKHPGAIFFGGQLVFPRESMLNLMFHNYVVFSIQRSFYRQGIPLMLLPIRVNPQAQPLPA